MSKKGKPTVVNDGVDFEQFKSVDVAPKECDVVEAASFGDQVVEEWTDNYAEENYEKQHDPHNQFDYNAKRNLKK